MWPYLNLLKQCRTEGVRQKNRTGMDSFMIPGGMMQFHLGAGFPILTTKKVNFRSIVGELIAFIQGADSAATFRRLGSRIWDANANENKTWLANPVRRGTDDLGRIYGVQWRDWQTPVDDRPGDRYEVHTIDQLYNVLEKLQKDPTDRRMIVSAWNPGEINQMALPPCHLLFQLLVGQEKKELHMTMYMRSCDMFLGVPFNISSYALFLSLLARVSGYTPGMLTMFLADVHIYENHLPQVDEQLSRMPQSKPKLIITTGEPPTQVDQQLAWLENLDPIHNIQLIGYEPAPAIKGDMAV